jgi:glycolate oxidase FAD binding subunit
VDLTAGALDGFAAEVGSEGPVVVVGGRTQWDVGGAPDPSAREVKAPSGIAAFEPAEMTVRVLAGTTVAELDGLLSEHGQMVALDPVDPGRATVGGVLAVGQSGVRRMRYGPIRDTVLEVRFVTAGGRLAKAGGPVVKNVSGFDLCRLMVGSLGTLGCLAEFVLRAHPRPAASQWWTADGVDPFDIRRRLFRPSSILSDGQRTWVLLEGHPVDVDAEREALGRGWDETDGPAVGARRYDERPVAPLDGRTAELNETVKRQFDPTGRFNPGRVVP